MTSRLNTTFVGLRRFAEGTSHELRTPLSIMKGEAEVLLKRVREPEEYQRVLRSIVEEIDFITKVMEGLGILSMGESGGIVLELKPIDLAGLLRRVDEEAKLLARGKGLSVILGKTEEATVTGDERWVRQLLLNLIDNAIKYTPSGGRITLSLEKTQGAARLSIEDTGIGIPEESLPRIFDRFYQVDKAKARAVGGYGLDLSICKWIVDAHGGVIEVSSRLEYGTKISVQLPLRNLRVNGTPSMCPGGLPTPQLQRVTEYIEAHLEHELSLTKIAAVAHMSPDHFARLFRQATGRTPHQYVVICRIERAKQLLRETEWPIIDLSRQVGFQDQSYFTAVFRKHVAMTPKAYRNDAHR
jgi:AraC-like DNA-binding protein